MSTGRGRGRPPGPTAQGLEQRERLYDTAIALIETRGFEQTTLREIAAEAGVSPGLLYKYFPSKRSLVLVLYDRLSARFAEMAHEIPGDAWQDRLVWSLRSSLAVLAPYRDTLTALVPVFFSRSEDSLFGEATAFSRDRVSGIFASAVMDAKDRPKPEVADALGRIAYLGHLAVIMWWMLDRSHGQRATRGLVGWLVSLLPALGLGLRLPPVRRAVLALDGLVRDALLE